MINLVQLTRYWLNQSLKVHSVRSTDLYLRNLTNISTNRRLWLFFPDSISHFDLNYCALVLRKKGGGGGGGGEALVTYWLTTAQHESNVRLRFYPLLYWLLDDHCPLLNNIGKNRHTINFNYSSFKSKITIYLQNNYVFSSRVQGVWIKQKYKIK